MNLNFSCSLKSITPGIETNIASHDSNKKALFVKTVVSLFSRSLLKGSMSRSVSEKNKNKKLLEAPYDRFVFLSLRSLGFTSISAQWNQDYNHKGISCRILFIVYCFAIFV